MRYKCMCLFVSYAHFCIVASKSETKSQFCCWAPKHTLTYTSNIRMSDTMAPNSIWRVTVFLCFRLTTIETAISKIAHTFHSHITHTLSLSLIWFKYIQIYANRNVMNQFTQYAFLCMRRTTMLCVCWDMSMCTFSDDALSLVCSMRSERVE